MASKNFQCNETKVKPYESIMGFHSSQEKAFVMGRGDEGEGYRISVCGRDMFENRIIA